MTVMLPRTQVGQLYYKEYAFGRVVDPLHLWMCSVEHNFLTTIQLRPLTGSEQEGS